MELSDPNQRLPFFHRRTDGGLDFGNLAVLGREDERVHFHRFKRDEVIAFFHFLSDRYHDRRDATRERAGHSAGAGRPGGRSSGWRGSGRWW